MSIRSGSSAFVVSLVVHVLILVPLLFISMAANQKQVQMVIETFFEEVRTQEEFTRELNTNTEVAETTNVISAVANAAAMTGAQASGGVGGVTAKIEGAQQFKDQDVALNVGSVDIPGAGDIGDDLGEGVVKGDPQAATSGYGEAMGRLTQEILRMMREDKVLVVWLFDESESMKDDQQEIKTQFTKVYAELGIQQAKDEKVRGKPGDENLLTAVHSFGAGMKKLTPKPTADEKEIVKAIDAIAIDETGKEQTCTAIMAAIDEYRQFRVRAKRKVVLIVVSDESGDDGEKVDEAITKAQAIKAPVYILGRESVFGYPYARMRWKDPKYGLDHWLLIKRGPETAYFEALQFDGLHDRWDAHPSGFAPFEQARLSRDTGGIFFVLPHEEQNLAGQAAVDKRKFEFLDMKEYVPELIPRKEYVEIRGKSKFRETVFEVAKSLDPWTNDKLNIREHWYPADKAAFMKEGQEMFTRGMNNFALLGAAVQKLEAIKPLREKEESARWRANYDLALAQCKAYRVRIFQYLLIMDNHLQTFPTPKDPKHNIWNLIRTKDVLKPTEKQIQVTKIDFEKLKKEELESREQFQYVIKTHPRTPWAHRAEYEMSMGFGWTWRSDFRDPRYDNINREIKFPTL